MASREVARQWFVPGAGIDRHVISIDIQRYLGNDATVRPGRGTGEHEGVEGYWIKAYRNLTSAMIADLRADSARWSQEQRSTGTRDTSYAGSTTHQISSGQRPARPNGDSPRAPDYGMAGNRDRAPPPRQSQDRMVREPQSQQRPFGQSDRGPYPPDRNAFPSDNRPYPNEPPMQPGFPSGPGVPNGRAPVPPPFGQTVFPGGPPNYPPQPPNDVPPPGYVRQGNFWVPISQQYESNPNVPGRPDPQYTNGAFNQPPYGARDVSRNYGHADYPDSRNPYPSPAATTIAPRDRDPLPASANASYGNGGPNPAGQYDPYGRPKYR